LIPDITGDCIALLQLANQLLEARGKKSETYVWNDPQPSEVGKSLDTYAEKIKEEIIKLLPAGPCFISGYSFGGSLAALVAQKLKNEEREAALFVIDAPSIEASQSYLRSSNNLSATRDLLEIFKHATYMACWYARLDTKNICMPDFSQEELEKLSQITSIEEQVFLLQERFLSLAQKEEDLDYLLSNYLAVVSQNLLSLAHYETKADIQPLKRVGLVLSEESKNKYNFDVPNSWSSYSEEQEIDVLEPADSTHLSLVKDKETSTDIAKKMAVYFHEHFTAEEISIMLFKHWKTNNPNVDLFSLVEMIEKMGMIKTKEPSRPHLKHYRNRLNLSNNEVQRELKRFSIQTDPAAIRAGQDDDTSEEDKSPNNSPLRPHRKLLHLSQVIGLSLFSKKDAQPLITQQFINVTTNDDEVENVERLKDQPQPGSPSGGP
ncbi:MAG TPA: thioesterase domain-containing protein, partial [Gammaproteobacteria bacterium]|nr:thioesterase domain-containing protein [Gammaproteobacteria bacterium]